MGISNGEAHTILQPLGAVFAAWQAASPRPVGYPCANGRRMEEHAARARESVKEKDKGLGWVTVGRRAVVGTWWATCTQRNVAATWPHVAATWPWP